MRNTTVVILALAAALLAVFAFRESRAARQARTALNTAVTERDGLRDRVADLEKQQDVLTAENASLRSTAVAAPTRPPPDTAPANRAFTTPMPRGRFNPIDVLESPEARQLMAIQQKAQLDARYAALFRALRLSPDRLERLKQLLVDKQNARMDVMAAARREDFLNPNSRDELAALVQKENQAIDASIRDLLGNTGFEEYQDYERTRSSRGVVDQLTNRLSYSDSPLTPQQTEALIDLLSAERSTRGPSVASDPTMGGMRVAIASGAGADTMVSFGPGSDGPAITETTLSSAENILTAEQLAALRQLQAEQLAQEKMTDLLRQSMRPGAAYSADRAAGTWTSGPAVETTPSSRP